MSDFCGSVEFMDDELLRTKLAQAMKDVQELSSEQERRSHFTSTEILADRLHRLLHPVHDCDYSYSKWPMPFGCRLEFWNLAYSCEKWFKVYSEKVPKGVSDDYPLGQLIKFLEIARFGS
jgi:hypothetical protein